MSKPAIQLDDLLTVDEAAKWLHLSPREVLAKSKGRCATIRGYWINRRVVRFHPRVVLAEMAAQAGVKPEVIAASFNLSVKLVVLGLILCHAITVSKAGELPRRDTNRAMQSPVHCQPRVRERQRQDIRGNVAAEARFGKIADAIRRQEGVWTYGIKTVRVTNESEARRVCLNTVANNYDRWLVAGRKQHFVSFLADRYCPPSDDPIGNRNWKRNVKLFLK